MSSNTISLAEYEAMMLRGMPEAELQRRLAAECKRLGLPYYHDPKVPLNLVRKVVRLLVAGQPVPSHQLKQLWRMELPPAGFPDALIPKPPTLYVWELKRVGGKVEPEQRAWGEALGACERIEYEVLDPRDWPRMQATLNGEGGDR
jgi:hypothetical protein